MRHSSLRQRLAGLHAAGNRLWRAPDRVGPQRNQRRPQPSSAIDEAAHVALRRYVGSMR
jgi:hypothetical protein